MGYLTGGLTFNTLRQANIKRLKTDKYTLCETDWTTAHWLQALVGELGELANILKKVDRGDNLPGGFWIEISKELADVQTYLDILAYKLDVDLGVATISKFNEVSSRVNSNIFIRGDGSDYYVNNTNKET